MQNLYKSNKKPLNNVNKSGNTPSYKLTVVLQLKTTKKISAKINKYSTADANDDSNTMNASACALELLPAHQKSDQQPKPQHEK